MSNSKKKGYYGSICGGNDKPFRKMYHKNFRSKNRDIISDCIKDFNSYGQIENHDDENIIINKIDRSVRFNDKYDWSSDGGTYYQGSLEDIRQRLDSNFFGIQHMDNTDIFDQYKALQKGRKTWSWNYIDILWKNNLIPRTFNTKDQIIEWYRANCDKCAKFLYNFYTRK